MLTLTKASKNRQKASQHWKRSIKKGFSGCVHLLHEDSDFRARMEQESCALDIRKSWCSATSARANAARAKKAVLRQMVFLPNQYWRKSYCTYKGTSRTKFGIKVENKAGRARKRKVEPWATARNNFLCEPKPPANTFIIVAGLEVEELGQVHGVMDELSFSRLHPGLPIADGAPSLRTEV